MENARARASKLAERHRDDRSRRSQVIRQLMLLVGAGVVAAAGAQPAAAAGWSIQSAPRPPHSGDTDLYGVSCTSTRDCTAVGQWTVPATLNPTPLVEHWDGTTWSVQRTPKLTAYGGGELNAVSCTSSDACTAVGVANTAYRQAPLVERWDGSAWSIQKTPAIDANGFSSVSCASSTQCMAVGGEDSFAERWDGKRWAIENIHFSDQRTLTNELDGVSCPSPSTCAAVGVDDVNTCSDPYYGGYYVPVLGFWTAGRWSLGPRSNRACSNSDAGGDLNAVSCTSTPACTAVGTQVYRWNGRGWSIQPAPISTGELDGVSCTAADTCTAVGSKIYAWNGRDWSDVSIPVPAGAASGTASLSSVSCLAADWCVAVGDYQNRAGRELPLIESER